MSFPNCTSASAGIEPNPDISGIGVRTAIYAQAILTLVQPILASLDGRISEDELVGLHQLYLGILLPGCALLFSAIIQDRTFGLSVYHAIITLNLSWINNTSALVFFQFALIAEMQLDKERDFRSKVGGMWELIHKPLQSVLKKSADDSEGSGAIWDEAQYLIRRMKEALRWELKNLKEHELEGCKELLEDVIQNLSALLAVNADSDELPEILQATEARLQTPRHRKSLGLGKPENERKEMASIGDWVNTKASRIGDLVKKMQGGTTVWELLERDWIMASLASAHLIILAAFGVWLWFKIHSFGDCPSRTEFTKLNIFVPVSVASQSLRIASLVIYIISLLPFINIVIFGGLEVGVIVGCQRLFKFFRGTGSQSSKSISSAPQKTPLSFLATRAGLLQFVVLTLLVQLYFIITTELTIRSNRHLLDSGSEEAKWTFGQTLAIALIAIPLVQVWNEARKPNNVEITLKFLRRVTNSVINFFRGMTNSTINFLPGMTKSVSGMGMGMESEISLREV